MIDYPKLLAWPFPEIEHRIEQRDTMLYALGVGFGYDPLDVRQLQFVYEQNLRVCPAMATILCHPGNWLSNPATGVNYLRQVNAGTHFVMHKSLPVSGSFYCRPKVKDIIDKGTGKGALIILERNVHDRANDELLCTVTSTSLCRDDGGFGGPSSSVATLPPLPDTAPDVEIDLPVARNAALIYRLSGDTNPLHANPDIARAAGFPEPILHGLATLGVASHALLKAFCDYDPLRIKSMTVRYSAPVIPGDIVRTSFWRSGNNVRFIATVPARNKTVLDGAAAELSS